MTGDQLAHRIGASAIGVGLAVWIVAYILEPPPLVTLWAVSSAAVAIWWGVHILVTKRPW